MNDPIGKQNSYYVIWHENIVVSFFLQRMPYSSMNPIEGRFSSGASRVLRPVPSYSETEVAVTKDRGWTCGLWASRAGYASWTCGPDILRKLWWLYNFMMPFRTRFVISYIFLANLGFEASSFLIENGSSSDQRSRLDLRPVGVQGRIRDLNLRARNCDGCTKSWCCSGPGL